MRDRLLMKCFQGRPRSERNAVDRFRGEHINWRWENLEDVVNNVKNVWHLIKARFDGSMFADAPQMVATVRKAIHDPLFLPMTHMLSVITKAVGHEASWFDGCFCHETELTSLPTYKNGAGLSNRARGHQPARGKGNALCLWFLGGAMR